MIPKVFQMKWRKNIGSCGTDDAVADPGFLVRGSFNYACIVNRNCPLGKVHVSIHQCNIRGRCLYFFKKYSTNNKVLLMQKSHWMFWSWSLPASTPFIHPIIELPFSTIPSPWNFFFPKYFKVVAATLSEYFVQNQFLYTTRSSASIFK